MTDASDPPVDGAEPRSALEPVPEPVTDAPVETAADPAAVPGEPADGEAMPGAAPAEPGAEVDVVTGIGIGGPATGAGPAEPVDEGADGDRSAARGADAAPAAAGGPAGTPGTDEAAPPAADVDDQVEAPAAGGGADHAPEDAAAPPGGDDLDVATGAGIGEPAPDSDDAAAIAGGEDEAPPADGQPTRPEAEAPPAAQPTVGEAATADAADGEAEAPAPAADATGQAAPPVLPPPPPELAEVPTDAGRIVSGRVREVRGDDVIVDLDDGRTGVINRRNLGIEGDPAEALPAGAAVEGAVLARSDPQHRVVLSRTWALKKRAWESIAAAAAEGTTLTGTVVSVGQKGVVVDVGVRGFVPASHLELSPVTELQGYAGQELSLKVLDVDVDRERLVLSRRSLLLKEQRRSLHDVLSALRPGEVRRGRVATLSDYGAFVDLGGVNGLVHLSELSWQRVRHPSEVLAIGDEVDVKVLDVKVKKRRVSLSIRQLTDDPLTALVPGEIRTGPVTRLVDFGAFVDLSGVEGLVHLSELAEYRVSAPEEIVAPGEEVRVKVLSVDRRRRRVELSIRQAAEYGG